MIILCIHTHRDTVVMLVGHESDVKFSCVLKCQSRLHEFTENIYATSDLHTSGVQGHTDNGPAGKTFLGQVTNSTRLCAHSTGHYDGLYR